MANGRKTLIADVVKRELRLDNTQYESIYDDMEKYMRESGLLGKQLRSIKAKAETTRIGRLIRTKYPRVFSRVSDGTLNINMRRLAQRVNSNTRRSRLRARPSNEVVDENDRKIDESATRTDESVTRHTTAMPAETLISTKKTHGKHTSQTVPSSPTSHSGSQTTEPTDAE